MAPYPPYYSCACPTGVQLLDDGHTCAKGKWSIWSVTMVTLLTIAVPPLLEHYIPSHHPELCAHLLYSCVALLSHCPLCHLLPAVPPYFQLCHPTSSCVTLLPLVSPYFQLCHPTSNCHCATILPAVPTYFQLCHPTSNCITLLPTVSPYFQLCHSTSSCVTLFSVVSPYF